MEFISLKNARKHSAEIRLEFSELLSNKAIVTKPLSRQWRFLSACIERMLGAKKKVEFDGIGKTTAAQLKFEVEDKITRYYLRPGKPLQYIFTLVHRGKLKDYGIENGERFPNLCGYCVLVRYISSSDQDALNSLDELRLYLERVVVEAADVEFQAYMALPEFQIDELKKWFFTGGPAYKEVLNILTRHRDRKWVLSNPYNPSSKRIMNINVKKIGKDEAIVHTTEYWYLRWWNLTTQKYAFPYRETNRQKYILRRFKDGWKIYQNMRPPPRTSAPNRKVR